MKKQFGILTVLGSALLLSACMPPPLGQAYWQRVEDVTAMYMTGPKAQQQLNEDIAGCVREVDELVELDSLRRATPPDSHGEYLTALEDSGDLGWYDTPTRHGDKKVAHKDFQDFEGCMRHHGWERVRFVRYNVMQKSKSDYTQAQQIRGWGGVPGGNVAMVEEHQRKEAEAEMAPGDFDNLN